MTYIQGFVAVIMDSNGNPLRDKNGRVYLPFGSEYSILLRNKTNSRASATIKIDGTPIANEAFIIPANDKVEIKRFMLDGDTQKGRAFKFVSKQEASTEVDTDDSDTGIVEVTFHKEIPSYATYRTWFTPHTWIGREPEIFYKATTISSTAGESPVCRSVETSQKGATIQGKEINQGFVTTEWNGDDKSSKVTIRLQLVAPKEVTQKTLSVSDKLGLPNFCTSCGSPTHEAHRFCGHCGTKLRV